MRNSLLVIGAFLGAGLGAYGMREVVSSCAVGVSGTDATVTVHGFRSDTACADLTRGSGATTIYDRQEPPTGRVLCEVNHNRQRYVVRDDGLLMITGRSICAVLNDPRFWQGQQTSSPAGRATR
jgi:hypothetical protein